MGNKGATWKDNLTLSHEKTLRIEELEKADRVHQDKIKELLRALTVANRTIKKQEKKLENYKKGKELEHLKKYIGRLEKNASNTNKR